MHCVSVCVSVCECECVCIGALANRKETKGWIASIRNMSTVFFLVKVKDATVFQRSVLKGIWRVPIYAKRRPQLIEVLQSSWCSVQKHEGADLVLICSTSCTLQRPCRMIFCLHIHVRARILILSIHLRPWLCDSAALLVGYCKVVSPPIPTGDNCFGGLLGKISCI